MKLPSFLVGRKWVWLCTVLVGKRTNASRFLGWILNQRKTKWAGTGCKEPCQCPVDTHRPKEDFKCSPNLQMITKFGAFSALLTETQIFSSKCMILCVCMWNKLTQGNQCIFLIDGYGAQSTPCGWRQFSFTQCSSFPDDQTVDMYKAWYLFRRSASSCSRCLTVVNEKRDSGIKKTRIWTATWQRLAGRFWQEKKKEMLSERVVFGTGMWKLVRIKIFSLFNKSFTGKNRKQTPQNYPKPSSQPGEELDFQGKNQIFPCFMIYC